MQLVNVFALTGNGMAHPPSFAHHASGVINHKAKDSPTLALKTVRLDNEIADNTASAFFMYLKGRNPNSQDYHSRNTSDSDSDIIKVKHAALASLSCAAGACIILSTSVCVDAAGSPANFNSKPFKKNCSFKWDA